MLDTLSPTYYYDYIYYMKLKESSPNTFEKVMSDLVKLSRTLFFLKFNSPTDHFGSKGDF